MGGAAPDTGGHLLVKAHYAQTIESILKHLGGKNKQTTDISFIAALFCQQDFQIHFRRFQLVFNEICQLSFEVVLDCDEWEGFCAALSWFFHRLNKI